MCPQNPNTPHAEYNNYESVVRVLTFRRQQQIEELHQFNPDFTLVNESEHMTDLKVSMKINVSERPLYIKV